jgi:hypothetical protein
MHSSQSSSDTLKLQCQECDEIRTTHSLEWHEAYSVAFGEAYHTDPSFGNDTDGYKGISS